MSKEIMTRIHDLGIRVKMKEDAYAHVLVYHHYDADGYAAAALAGAKFLLYEPSDATFHASTDLRFFPVSHNNPMQLLDTLESIGDDPTIVFILDYSFSREDDQDDIRWASTKSNVDIVWIDHHYSSKALEDAEGSVFKKIPGLRILTKGSKYAGCALTLFWMKEAQVVGEEHAMLNPYMSDSQALEIYEDLYKFSYRCPTLCFEWKWVAMVSDYDTFTNAIGESAGFVKYCNFNGLYKTFLDYKGWNISKEENVDPPFILDAWRKYNAYPCIAGYDEISVLEFVKRGNELQKIDDVRNRRAVEESSWVTKMAISIAKRYIDPDDTLDIPTDDGMIVCSYDIIVMNRGGKFKSIRWHIRKIPCSIIISFRW